MRERILMNNSALTDNKGKRTATFLLIAFFLLVIHIIPKVCILDFLHISFLPLQKTTPHIPL